MRWERRALNRVRLLNRSGFQQSGERGLLGCEELWSDTNAQPIEKIQTRSWGSIGWCQQLVEARCEQECRPFMLVQLGEGLWLRRGRWSDHNTPRTRQGARQSHLGAWSNNGHTGGRLKRNGPSHCRSAQRRCEISRPIAQEQGLRLHAHTPIGPQQMGESFREREMVAIEERTQQGRIRSLGAGSGQCLLIEAIDRRRCATLYKGNEGCQPQLVSLSHPIG